MSFSKYLEEKNEKKITQEINEGVGEFVGTVLGYGTAGLAIAFGGTLLVYAGVKSVGVLARLWRKIFKTAKGIGKPQEIIRKVKMEPLVKREKAKIDLVQKRYEDELQDVLSAIHEKDFDTAKQEFMALSRLKSLPDVHKIIIKEITKTFQEPPLYVVSPGNGTYQAIKKILGIRTARAAAEATKMSLEKEMEEEEEKEE